MTIPLLLQRHRVPWFRLIWPEERALIVHALEGDGYRAIATLSAMQHRRVRVPPFEAMELDLAAMLTEWPPPCGADGHVGPRCGADQDTVGLRETVWRRHRPNQPTLDHERCTEAL